MLRPLDARKAEQALAIALPLAAKLPGPDAHRVEIDAFIEQWDDVKGLYESLVRTAPDGAFVEANESINQHRLLWERLGQHQSSGDCLTAVVGLGAVTGISATRATRPEVPTTTNHSTFTSVYPDTPVRMRGLIVPLTTHNTRAATAAGRVALSASVATPMSPPTPVAIGRGRKYDHSFTTRGMSLSDQEKVMASKKRRASESPPERQEMKRAASRPSKSTGRLSTDDPTVDVNGFPYAATSRARASRIDRYDGERVPRDPCQRCMWGIPSKSPLPCWGLQPSPDAKAESRMEATLNKCAKCYFDRKTCHKATRVPEGYTSGYYGRHRAIYECKAHAHSESEGEAQGEDGGKASLEGDEGDKGEDNDGTEAYAPVRDRTLKPRKTILIDGSLARPRNAGAYFDDIVQILGSQAFSELTEGDLSAAITAYRKASRQTETEFGVLTITLRAIRSRREASDSESAASSPAASALHCLYGVVADSPHHVARNVRMHSGENYNADQEEAMVADNLPFELVGDRAAAR